ncbi:MAG: DUF5820 family protein [Halobacteriales archaeon]|nr:DUF5820 family protein [Halobacteriales archaeon]
MDPLADLPEGWEVWNAEPGGRVVLAYRPDVFDGDAFPPACLPTLTVAPGRSPDGRPDPRGETGRWHVALYLEPDVRVRDVEASFDERASAVERAVAVAAAFVAGEVDYRGAYHEPPEGYLDRLDELVRAG